MLLEEGLTARGLHVNCAATPEEALAHVQHSTYDAVLCDLHLSAGGFTVDGRDAASRILEAAGTQKPVVIYMTGDLLESIPGAAGGSQPICLQKPFRISDVLALLKDVLSAATAESRHT
jgi:CheY-like chemotaxis protein